MKKLLLLACTFLCAFSFYGQNTAIPNCPTPNNLGIEWDRTYGGSGSDNLTEIIRRGNNLLLGGTSYSPISGDKTQSGQGGADYWIVFTDLEGNKIWDRTFGGSGEDVLHSVIAIGGGYYLIGNSDSNISGDKSEDSRGGKDFWVIKLDLDGNKVWDKTFGGDNTDFATTISSNGQGGLFIGGSSNSMVSGDKSAANQGGNDFWLLSVDQNGNKIWDKTYGGSGDDTLRVIKTDNRPGEQAYLLAGRSDSNASADKSENSRGMMDFWIVKIDTDGDIIWDKTYGGNGRDALNDMQDTIDDGFVLAGDSQSTVSGEKSEGHFGLLDYWVVKIDADGNLEWENTIGGTGSDSARSVITNFNSEIVLIGLSSSNISNDKTSDSIGSTDFWIVKLGSDGCKMWDSTVGGMDFEVGLSAINGIFDPETPEFEKFIVAGYSSSNQSRDKTEDSKGETDYWIMQMGVPRDPISNFTLVDADTNTDILILEDGMVYDADIISTGVRLNIRANADGVGSVDMKLRGALDKNRTETAAPYALYGDNNGNYFGTNFPLGAYTLTATPYSGPGATGTAGEPSVVNFTFAVQPTAVASANILSGEAPLEVRFTGSNSQNENPDSSLEYLWDFGDGATAVEADPTHVFQNPGTYTVQLTTTNVYGFSDTTSLEIVVNEPVNTERPFITTWKTDNPGVSADNQITIPTFSGESYDYTIDWGDGTSTSNVNGNSTHTYASAGVYTVSITGDFPRIFFSNTGDKNKILTVEQWGDIKWTSMVSAFAFCGNLDVVATDAPDFSETTSLSSMFFNCPALVGNSSFSAWDVSTITVMANIFNQASLFNQDISGWNVSNVINFDSMFSRAAAFNQPIGNWNVSRAEDMSSMFFLATSFNQDIGDWTVDAVTDMTGMFNGAIAFNQNIGNWNVGNVTKMNSMFSGIGNNTTFNQDISQWNVSNVESMFNMFANNTAFNQDIGSWNVGNVRDFRLQFSGATAFDQNLGGWDVQSAQFMADMFNGISLSLENYDALLNGWNSLPNLPNNIIFDGGTSQYCFGETARQNIIDSYGWTITDGGVNCPEPSISIDSFTFVVVDLDFPETSFDAFEIEDGKVYDINLITGFAGNIRANTNSEQVRSVAFSLTGELTHTQTENVAPYALYGDVNGVYNNMTIFSPGTYMLSATPYSERNRAGDAGMEETVTFTLGFKPTAIASANVLLGEAPLTVNFTGSNSQDEVGVVEYFWNFGDGVTSNIADPVHTYSTEGTYEVSLKVSNDIGLEDMINLTIEVTPELIDEASFITTWKTDNEGLSEDNQITIPTDLNEIYNYTIAWGDGTSNTNVTGDITHTYLNPGVYDVTITGQFPRINFGISQDKEKIVDIKQWGDIEWNSFENAFLECSNLDVTATDMPDLSNATSLASMFTNSGLSNPDFSNWDVSTITNMSFMFQHTDFTGNISNWDVSNVTDMSFMFSNSIFNQEIGNWDVGNVNDMSFMFETSIFNQDIGSWDVSAVSRMDDMFNRAAMFNQDIGNWNVSNVRNMTTMFANAESFNQDIGNWNVSNVSIMFAMFSQATSFDQDIGNWNVSKVSSMDFMFFDVTLSMENYDSLLQGWSSLPSLVANVSFSAGNSQYCLGEEARQNLIDTYGWSITDNGLNCPDRAFITTWKTDNPGISADNQITIPVFFDATYNYSVDWGDGTSNTGVTGAIRHTYATPGTYTVTITGDFPQIHFGLTNPSFDRDRQKILSVEQWGSTKWLDMDFAFMDCINLDIKASDVPDLSIANSTRHMFRGCVSLIGNSNFADWNLSNITDASSMFNNASLFNQNIDDWDVSKMENMKSMFAGASSFDQPIGSWDVSMVTDMTTMFSGTPFNQDIGNWNVSNVTIFAGMFGNNSFFNQDISSWNVTRANNISSMFDGASSFNQDISSWDVSNIIGMSNLFENATEFNQNLANWDVSSVTSFSRIFSGTALSSTNYDEILIGWASLPTVQSNLVLGAGDIQYCNGENARQLLIDTYGWLFLDGGLSCPPEESFITRWKTDFPGASNNRQITIPTDPGEIYNYTIEWGDGSSNTNVNGSISHTYAVPGIYDVSISGQFPRINFSLLPQDARKIIDIRQWGNSQWSSFENAFNQCSGLDMTATDVPDLSNVTSLASMFALCFNLVGNPSMSNWDVSSVENMSNMFEGTIVFNQDISSWNVSNVVRMSLMFSEAFGFRQNIGAWDVSNVTDMSGMFFFNAEFNEDISNWDVGSVTNMSSMFFGAISFDQNLGSWNISNAQLLSSMFFDAGLSQENYDATLIGWNSLPSLQSNVIFDGGNSQYCLGEDARQNLINTYGWTIVDGGLNCPPEESFITVWKTDNEGLSEDNQITIPTSPLGEVYNYTVDWGDGSTDTGVTGDMTHTYATPGTYTVSISGEFPRIYFNNPFENIAADDNKIISVTQWGTNEWTSMQNAFAGCENLDILATDAPDIDEVNDFSFMFYNCTSLSGNASMNNWDMSSANLLINMFTNASSFNADIGNWDVSSVTNLNAIFLDAHTFNQDIGNWDVSLVTNFALSFAGASAFNQDIGRWDVGNAVTMNGTFSGARAFNQDIGNWNVASVTDFSLMFIEAIAFNQDIGGWNVSAATDMGAMFSLASAFNQDIGNWNVGNVTRMDSMFADAISFNQDLGSWNVANVNGMNSMFFRATSFDQNLGTWDVGSVTDMFNMFEGVSLSTRNYDDLLIGWSNLPSLQSNVFFGGGNNTFCLGIEGRINIANAYSWTFSDGGANCDDITIGNFTMIDANTDLGLFILSDNDVLDKATDLNNLNFLNVRANTNANFTGSIVFALSGALNFNQTESVAPYALFGDRGGDYAGMDFPVGTYTLMATAYSGLGGTGDVVETRTINFTITDQAMQRMPYEVSLSPNAAVTEVNVSVSDISVEVVDILIYDMQGRAVMSYKASQVQNSDGYQLPVNTLAAGTYILTTIDSQGVVNQKQLLVKK